MYKDFIILFGQVARDEPHNLPNINVISSIEFVNTSIIDEYGVEVANIDAASSEADLVRSILEFVFTQCAKVLFCLFQQYPPRASTALSHSYHRSLPECAPLQPLCEPNLKFIHKLA